MRKIALAVLVIAVFCRCAATKKRWEAVVSTPAGKERGTLVRVTDSFLVVMERHGLDSVALPLVRKLKLIRKDNETSVRVLAALAGGAVGGGAGALALTHGKSQSPARAMGGVIGFVFGSLAGMVVGGGFGPAIHNLWAAKTIRFVHTETFYRSLPALLKPYLPK